MRKKKKVFGLRWVFEPISELSDFSTRRMFGGEAAYAHGRMVLVIMESEKDPRWNGVLVPTDFVHQKSLVGEVMGVTQHPILKKWLYLRSTDPRFEGGVSRLQELILKDDPRVGIYPKPKRPSKKKK